MNIFHTGIGVENYRIAQSQIVAPDGSGMYSARSDASAKNYTPAYAVQS